MRRLVAGGALLGLVLGLGFALPARVAAHALLTASDPPRDVSLATAPTAVTLTFTEAPDPKLSRIQVLDSSGVAYAAGAAEAVAGEPSQLRAALRPLPPGVYTVAWRTVSAVDGHDAAGSFAFSVGVPLPIGGGGGGTGATGATGTALSPGVVFSRWLLYLALMASLGAAFVGTLIARVPATWLLRWLVGGFIAAAAATLLLVGFQAVETGAALSDILGSSLARTSAARAVPVVVLGLASIVALRSAPRQRAALIVAGLATAAAMLVDAATSHAAAGPLPVVNVGIQWLHVSIAGLWVGGVAALLVQVRAEPPEVRALTARRFAWFAGFGLIGVGLTGLARAIVEVGSLDQLLTTDFGRLVVLKAVLLEVLGALGAVNHFWSVPAAGRTLGRLRRVGSGELLVGSVVVLLAASLVNVPPPTEASLASGSGSVVATGSDYATTVRLRLAVSPGVVGQNDFVATVTDYDTGAAASIARVTLRFRLPARPDVGASSLTLEATADGSARGSGSNLSIEGTWAVTALVDRGTSTAEVPLELAVREPPQQVDVSRVPGGPTLYTVHLAGGRFVQVYLDPDTVGRNDFHATFFDADGTELPATDIEVSIAKAGGTPRNLGVVVLEPGHAVAPLVAGPDPLTYVIIATAPDGQPLRARLDITPGS